MMWVITFVSSETPSSIVLWRCGKTAEVGNVVVVHLGGDLLDGKVGLGKVVFEFVDDGIVDEGLGGGLHQTVADFVQIIGTETQLGSIELHAAFMVDMLVQKRVEAVGDAPDGRFLIVNLGWEKLGNPLLYGDEEVVQFAVNHLLADFTVEGSNDPFHPSKPFFSKPLCRLLDDESRIPIKEIPKHRRVEVDREIGNGGVAHLDETTRKTRRSAFDGESRMGEKRHQHPTTDGHRLEMPSADGTALGAEQQRTPSDGNHFTEQSLEIGRSAKCRQVVIWAEK